MSSVLVRAPRRPLGGVRRKVSSSIGAAVLAVSALVTGAHAGELRPGLTSPDVSVAAGERPDSPSVFGTVPLPTRVLPTGTRWSRVMGASLNQPALARLTMAAGTLSRQDQVAFVQSAVNRAVRNGARFQDCADDGYWAAADETLTKGVGDCIDIAVAKMEALRMLGIPNKDLYLTTGYVGTGKGRESAALLVRIDGGFWLLSEQFDRVIEAGSAAAGSAAFTPILTYGVGTTWVHGRRVAAASLGN